MALKENHYRILLVASSEKLSSSILKLLAKASFLDVTLSTSLSEAGRLMIERQFEILIISSPVNTESALDFAINVIDKRSDTSILYLTDESTYNEIYDKTLDLGILTLSRPTSVELFVQAMGMIVSTRDRMSSLKNKGNTKLSFEERMAEIKIVNEAKLLLMKYEKMKEEDAHHYIVSSAMNFRRSKTEMAKIIIEKYKERIN